jgi:hypothetical protein
MAVELILSEDCKTLTISAGVGYENADLELYYNDVNTAQNLVDGLASNNSITTLDGTGNLILDYTNIPSVTGEELNGVIKVVILTYDYTDPYNPVLLEKIEKGAIGMCKLNCCIAKKVRDLVECTCATCKECVSLLDEVTKVYLLSKGIEVNIAGCVQTQALYKKSIEEYNKAVEICGLEDCDCNC